MNETTSLHPARLPGACPRCHGDLEWDAGEMVCQRGCGYKRSTLAADPRDLVVVEARAEYVEAGAVLIASLAQKIGLSPTGVLHRMKQLGIESKIGAHGRSYVTAEEAERVISYQPKNVKTGWQAQKKSVAPKTSVTPSSPPGVFPPETRTVRLRSGGTITVTLAVSLLALSAHDRDFLFNLVDRLAEYEVRH